MRIAAAWMCLCLWVSPVLAQEQPSAEQVAAAIQGLTGRPVTVLAGEADHWSLQLPGGANEPPITVERLTLPIDKSLIYALDEALGPDSQARAVAEVRGDAVLIVRNTTPGRARALLAQAWKNDPMADQQVALIGMRDERGSVSLVRDPQGSLVSIERGPNPELVDALRRDVSRLAGSTGPHQAAPDSTAAPGSAPPPAASGDQGTRDPQPPHDEGLRHRKRTGITEVLGR